MRRRSSSIPQLARALAAAAAVAALMPAAALGQCPQTTLGEVEQEVMCPICGTPLALATEAPQAQRERAFIEERIARCESKEEIKAALVAEYGEAVLATPGDDGFELAAYLLPGLAVVGGIAGVAFAALRWRRGRAAGGDAAASSGGPQPSKAEAERLDADLRRYDL